MTGPVPRAGDDVVPDPGDELLPPVYDGGLGAVLPSLAASLGVTLRQQDGEGDPPGWSLPPARSAVLVLVDGLGAEQLARAGGHAPFLTGMPPLAAGLRCGFPSTTATSIATLGTGLPPGRHGLVGWLARMPGQDRLLNHLSWHEGPDPRAWQPHRTVGERLAGSGVVATQVAPGGYAGSGLTEAALRGWEHAAADTPGEKVAAALAVLRRGTPALVYVHLGEVDRAGHEHGPGSWQWTQALEEVDAALEDLAESLPAGVSLTVTADHGMVASPEQDRHDLADEADLAAGVTLLGGEPRAPQPAVRPGAAADVAATWREVLGTAALVLTREEAVAAGWFGPRVDPEVLPRIGDLVVAMRGTSTVLDSRELRSRVVALRGHHGSLTLAETALPLRHRPPS